MLGTPLARAETASFASQVLPVFQHNCSQCHGEKKQKAGLRLDAYDFIAKGSENGAVIKPGNAQDSEIYRRILLSADDEDFMPSGGKPPLSAHDIELLKQWLVSGAPRQDGFDVPAVSVADSVVFAAAPDYRTRLRAAREAADHLGVRLIPRSAVPTDGLVLRTASSPGHCTDAALAQLSPFADLIVDAELSRTKITDKSLQAISSWKNLQELDISYTSMSSGSAGPLAQLPRLQVLNISGTHMDAASVAKLQTLPAIRHVWAFLEPPAPRTIMPTAAASLPPAHP
jgi:hypothetical protein